MTVTDGTIMSGKEDDHVSPYLRRPLRSLREYLKEVAQRRNRAPDPTHQTGESERPNSAMKDGRRGEEE